MNTKELDRKHFHGWLTLAMAGVVMLVIMGIIFTFQLFLPILCKEFGWSRAMVGGAGSLGTVLMGLAAPLSGLITTKKGAKTAIVVGNIMVAIGLSLLIFQSQPWHLYLGFSLLAGAGGGIGSMLPTTTLANNWFVRKRSLALSIITSSGNIGGFVILPLVTAIVAKVGWKAGYLALAGIVVVFNVVIPGLLIKNRPEDVGQVPDGVVNTEIEKDIPEKPGNGLYNTPVDFTLGEAIKTRALWIIIIVDVSVLFIMSMVITHQMAYLETLGITGMVAASAAGLMGGIGVVGALGIGFLGLRINMLPLTVGCMALISAGMGLLMIADNLVMVFTYNIVLGTGIGAFMTGVMGLLTSYFGRSHFPKILGFVMPFVTLLGSLGGLVAGAIFDAAGSYRIAFLSGLAFAAVCLILIFFAGAPKHPSFKKKNSAP